jgi:hypothetical protein
MQTIRLIFQENATITAGSAALPRLRPQHITQSFTLAHLIPPNLNTDVAMQPQMLT